MNCFRKLLAAIASGALACTVLAQQVSKEQIKGLDEQVQDIKKDALALALSAHQQAAPPARQSAPTPALEAA